MSLLHTENLDIGYRPARRPVVSVAEGLHLELLPGELVCLLGPNGAGKSTLLRTLAGMQPPLAGDILLMGESLAGLSAQALARRLSIVLTERLDTGPMTGYSLVALGRHPHTNWLGQLRPHDEALIQWAVAAVGAEALAARPVTELSDGERQKLLIARALAQEAPIILLDEPTAFLDLPRRVEIMRLLHHLAQSTQRAVLVSTHDLDLALRSAHRLWLLSRQGQMQVGAPEDLVLNGAFQEVFHSEGIEFDSFTGMFRVQAPARYQIQVKGEGLAALWTRRALERVGFSITTDAPWSVEVHADHSPPQWQLRHSSQQFPPSPSIYQLLQSLRQHFNPASVEQT